VFMTLCRDFNKDVVNIVVCFFFRKLNRFEDEEIKLLGYHDV